jgi:Zn-dependent peptidase ImmA (M78 family)
MLLKDFWVPKKTKSMAEAEALNFRAALGEQDSFRPDALGIAECVLDALIGCELVVCDDSKMLGVEAYTQHIPALGTRLFVKASLVARLQQEHPDPRARFTLAHEFGHIVMHRGRSETGIPSTQMRMAPARGLAAANQKSPYLPAEFSGETQANWFASEFLMPKHLVRECFSAEDVHKRFNVSRRAAEIKWAELNPQDQNQDYFKELRKLLK